MTVPASCEGSMNIDDLWTEEGVLGGAASSIGDSNLGWAGSSLQQEDDSFKKEADQSFCVKPQQNPHSVILIQMDWPHLHYSVVLIVLALYPLVTVSGLIPEKDHHIN